MVKKNGGYNCMRDVNGHMDELFSKAADNYMLKKGESHWNEISGRLESSMVFPASPVHKNGKTRKYIITGTLLFLCFVAGILFDKYAFINEAMPVITKYQNSTANNKVNKHLSSPVKKDLQKDKIVQETHTKKTAILNTIPVTTNQISAKSYPAYKPRVDSNTENAFAGDITGLPKLPVLKDKTGNRSIQAHESTSSLNNKPGDNDQSLPKDNSPIKLTVKNQHGMYCGLLSGAGFTTVKSQGFSKPGFDIGLVAGYQLSARSSVELNLVYTHKYYYSDSRYFSMDKLKNDMPANMKLMSVKGNSSIIEIPVKLRYNLIQKNNGAIYVSAGISSYILMNERNNYVTSTDGTMGNMYGNYTKTTGYFAGALNISAGYMHTAGRNNAIRFEPYIAIPLKGIGMGDLPVTTSGLHVLFTIAPHR